MYSYVMLKSYHPKLNQKHSPDGRYGILPRTLNNFFGVIHSGGLPAGGAASGEFLGARSPDLNKSIKVLIHAAIELFVNKWTQHEIISTCLQEAGRK